ncbi:pyridoxamine 5'-phosphate oxidase family protein [Euzebya sp.]|uniref:pyridoxamine 5'-phosphate oxidase family protein n=1 Tax=Euzebya sp. TaxID=1971409 RepID=UPI00351596A5
MPSRREQIVMSDEEVLGFLSEERTVACASNGPEGWPHVVPLWYVVRGPASAATVWAWTFAKSRKVVNLESDPRATLQVEAGETYDQLRGVMLETEVVIHRDLEVVTALGLEIMARYAGGSVPEGAEEGVRRQAEKRVGLEFVERSRASWDHRKLGGTY